MSVATAGGSRSYNFKIVLLGEGCVGKTSLVLRYVEDKFNDRHITTLQVLIKSHCNMLRGQNNGMTKKILCREAMGKGRLVLGKIRRAVGMKIVGENNERQNCNIEKEAENSQSEEKI
ncbi:Ras-related protein Rab-21 [Portunus trituberculatus]|uniref:Ras-related protein Rab-21 n=1 Tax=Portunus trituberculatus TaxID=210409 RepID=A0A5B7GCG6_PORTR|nr:Ras-related protein Rab-21 [Portunus trituberculatus]